MKFNRFYVFFASALGLQVLALTAPATAVLAHAQDPQQTSPELQKLLEEIQKVEPTPRPATQLPIETLDETHLGAGEVQCFHFASTVLGRDMNYCMQRSRPDLPRKVGEPVVFFFHGIMGSHEAWEGLGYADTLAEIRRQDPKLMPFTVISIETQKLSFFADFHGETHGGRSYETYIINEFIPHIIKRYQVCSKPKCMAFMGYSMGGHGALKIALKTKYTSIVAVASPAVAPVGLYDTDQAWDDYWAGARINPYLGKGLIKYLRAIIPVDQAKKNEPFELLKDKKASQLPDLFVAAGGNDEFGFENGFVKLLTTLRAKGIKWKHLKTPQDSVIGNDKKDAYYFEPTGDHMFFEAPAYRMQMLSWVSERLKAHRADK